MFIPSFFNTLHQARPKFALLVEGLSVRGFPRRGGLPTRLLLNRIPRAVLSAHVVSFEAKYLWELVNSSPEPTTSTLYTALVACFRLRELRLEGGLLGFHMPVNNPCEKLPPLKRLVLCRYNWTYSDQELGQAHWDLSRLTQLELHASGARHIFTHVPPDNFARLRSLKIDPGQMPPLYTRPSVMGKHKEDAAKLRIALDHIDALEELSMTCWLSELPLSTITRHGASLRSLKLYDHQWFDQFSNRTLYYLETIRETCPHLTTLSLNLRDFDIPVLPHNDFSAW